MMTLQFRYNSDARVWTGWSNARYCMVACYAMHTTLRGSSMQCLMTRLLHSRPHYSAALVQCCRCSVRFLGHGSFFADTYSFIVNTCMFMVPVESVN